MHFGNKKKIFFVLRLAFTSIFWLTLKFFAQLRELLTFGINDRQDEVRKQKFKDFEFTHLSTIVK